MGNGNVNVDGTSILPHCVLSHVGRHDLRLQRVGEGTDESN